MSDNVTTKKKFKIVIYMNDELGHKGALQGGYYPDLLARKGESKHE